MSVNVYDRYPFDERYKPTGAGTSICVSQQSHTKRYCEGCQQYKPKTASSLHKGWRCVDCKRKELKS